MDCFRLQGKLLSWIQSIALILVSQETQFSHLTMLYSFFTSAAIICLISCITVVEVKLRPTVSQPVFVSGSPMTRFLFLVWQLRVSWCGAPSLTKEWVCNLFVQLLLGLDEAVTRRTHDHILLSFETPPTWRARSPYLFHPGSGWPSYTPGHWVPILSPLTTRGATVEVF
jgi:hypothetical protein